MSRKAALKVLAILLAVFLLLLCAAIVLYFTIGPKTAPAQPHPPINATTKDCCRGRDGQCAEDPFLRSQLKLQPIYSMANRLSTGEFFDDWNNKTAATHYLHCVLGGEEGAFAANASECCLQMR